MTTLHLYEHDSPHYGPRTAVNAKTADLTIAFAIDFTTAGEKLTKKLSDNYLAIDMYQDTELSKQQICAAIIEHDVKVLNIAGNGIYTLWKAGIDQTAVNTAIYEMLKQVHAETPIHTIRSGGQTGVDTAGLVAAIKLDIHAVGLYPKGFKQRYENGVDQDRTKEFIQEWLEYEVNRLGQ